jgi:putative ABC transport system permease protein
MFARIVGESFARNPRRKLLTAAALVLGMATATATLTVALDEGDRLAREFRSFGANLLVTPQSDTLPVQIGGVDYRPVSEGAYLSEANLGELKTIFWRYNIIGFTPFLELPVAVARAAGAPPLATTLIGTWYAHPVAVPEDGTFTTGLGITHPWWQIEGAWFEDGAEQCVVGRALAERLAIRPGDRLEVRTAGPQGERSASLLVAGILSTGDSEEEAVVAPLALAQRLADHSGQYRRLLVSALTKPEDDFGRRNPATMTPADYDRWYCSPYVSSIAKQVQEVLPGTDVRPIRRVAQGEGRILGRVSALFWLVTLAALVAAALAVAATAATTVLERRREVGLMKALGAARGLVAAFFLAEQLLVALLGGALGYAFGVVLARQLGRSVFGSATAQRPILLPVVLGLAALVVLAGSLVPLWRAARIAPAPILRGE